MTSIHIILDFGRYHSVSSSYPLASTNNALSRPWLHKETSDDLDPVHLRHRSMIWEAAIESLTY